MLVKMELRCRKDTHAHKELMCVRRARLRVCNLMSQYLIYTMQGNAAQWNAMKHSILWGWVMLCYEDGIIFYFVRSAVQFACCTCQVSVRIQFFCLRFAAAPSSHWAFHRLFICQAGPQVAVQLRGRSSNPKTVFPQTDKNLGPQHNLQQVQLSSSVSEFRDIGLTD